MCTMFVSQYLSETNFNIFRKFVNRQYGKKWHRHCGIIMKMVKFLQDKKGEMGKWHMTVKLAQISGTVI